ncbi:glycoside hydrolase family 76 protein [Pseudactinotalea suaedae]|uniref:glycoside hydrolase family 76 protein n=1 Tax=Pseudactinotalea suaedae TaxID=1524924 RepID=UPI0012E2C0B1|nr:glycoside hydrolase family 76 protein [Pseudactinotalea suaedae]
MTDVPQRWPDRADLAQRSLDLLWGAPWPQLLHNAHPVRDDTTFNYWWLAHAVDCRLDAYARTGAPVWLDAARTTARNVVERNGGSLVNDYFDDMLWYALALLRLAESDEEGSEEPLRDVGALWTHVLEHGWTDAHGWSMSWRRQQPYYKNTPANGPFIILGARLARRTGSAEHLEPALASMAWLRRHLVREDGFVWDGLGREGGDEIDSSWRFTYNQGLFIGACVELFRTDGDTTWLDLAQQTAEVSITELAREGVFVRDGGDLDDRVPDVDGADTGLFKGIWFRYATQLLLEREVPAVRDLLRSSTDALWRSGVTTLAAAGVADAAPAHTPDEPVLRAGDDWLRPAPREVGYSTQLSAIMATEARASIDG